MKKNKGFAKKIREITSPVDQKGVFIYFPNINHDVFFMSEDRVRKGLPPHYREIAPGLEDSINEWLSSYDYKKEKIVILQREPYVGAFVIPKETPVESLCLIQKEHLYSQV